jgi:hypothetical protein
MYLYYKGIEHHIIENMATRVFINKIHQALDILFSSDVFHALLKDGTLTIVVRLSLPCAGVLEQSIVRGLLKEKYCLGEFKMVSRSILQQPVIEVDECFARKRMMSHYFPKKPCGRDVLFLYIWPNMQTGYDACPWLQIESPTASSLA